MFQRFFFATLLTTSIIPALNACQVGCVEDGSGTTCSAKSLERFDGAPSAVQSFDAAPGAPVKIDVLYGHVMVQHSTSGKIEVQFGPYAYVGHGEKARADQLMAQNLKTSATAAGGVTVTVQREGGTNGLGADVVVRLPDNFDGAIDIVNQGGGPLNHFDVKVDYVAKASAISVINRSQLGACSIQGAPSVRRTTVQCQEEISVLDVSDAVSIENLEKRFDATEPAITLRIGAVTPGSGGGRVVSASGTIAATFPRGAAYTLAARSPVKGMVQEGAPLGTCAKETPAPNQKTIRCGTGPTYELTAGAAPDYIGKPEDSNVVLDYR